MSFESVVRSIGRRRVIGRPVMMAYRAGPLFVKGGRAVLGLGRWLVTSREDTNYTYDLDPLYEQYLAAFVAVVAGCPTAEVLGYFRELHEDAALRRHVRAVTEAHPEGAFADAEARYGRRLGWYALVRATKPRVVVETGVDKGLGSVVLCAALLRNRAEGAPGAYYGTDINPQAGYLLQGPYAETGRILYGDSLASLEALEGPVDLLINDSDHSADYEGREYAVVAPKLSERAVVLGDNAHVTDELYRFARRTGRHFLFFHEQPYKHWYPGGGIGAAFGQEAGREDGA
jgi:hypothetical protein